ncbi:MAG TPA: ABC transporter permease, partial [Chitinophagaceae bacterium]|nr:ABC transporter permease [Chitinophagaceae bacterium]
MFKNSLKMAWRNAVANRSYTIISLSSLVLGITLFFFIIIWVKRELSYDKNFPDAERICRVETDLQMQDGSTSALPGVGWPIGKILATDYPEIERVTYMRDWYPIINFKGTHFYEDALYADNEFFNVFQYQLSEGNAATALTEPFSFVISKQLKEKYFGNEQSVVGKILMISDTIPYKITGVFKDLSAPSHLKFDMIGSLISVCALYGPQDCKRRYASGWFDVNMYNYVKLKKNVPVDVAESKIKNLVLEKGKEAVAQTGFKPALKLRPVTEIYLYSGMSTGKGTTGNIKTVRLFLIIGIFILIIACLNFINLTTAKSVERAKEIGIKKVLGSNRRKLIFQFITETALLCFVATIISILLMIILLPLFNQ